MKKYVYLCLTILLCLSLCACGKSQAVKDTEAAIKEIGEVTIDSKASIEKAEKLYNILTDSEKEKLSNRMELVTARETFDALAKGAIYDNAQKVYNLLNEASDICVDGMDAIYDAWYFGIYVASKYENSGDLMYYGLASEINFRFKEEDLEEAHLKLWPGYENIVEPWMLNSFESSVNCVSMAFAIEGTYDRLDGILAEAQTEMQKLTEDYNDYTYYPKLKEYYSKVSSYADFFKSPSGSFEQLKGTITDYENNIRTYREDVGFLF